MFTPTNPAFASKVESIFGRAAFMTDLGVAIEAIEPGACTSRLDVMPRHMQQDGFIHAAVQGAMADHTAGAAAGTLVGPAETVLTVEYKIILLRPATGQLLRCRSRVLRPGKSLTFVESEVFAVSSGDHEKLTAKASVTLAVVTLPDGHDAGAGAGVDVCETRDGYNRWAEVYDTEQNPLISLEEPEVDAMLAEGRGSCGVRGLTIADIGCGTGRHTLRLARAGARVTGVDFSEGMLARAREKTASLSPHPELVVHDLAHRLPFPNETFDRVLCALVVDHIDDLAGLFSELGRICRRDGRIIVSTMHPAMMLRGVQARFRDPRTGRETRPASAPNQIADYVNAAVRAGLVIEQMHERSVSEELAERVPRARKYLGWPMLLMMAMRASR